jgi:hypothetical protein
MIENRQIPANRQYIARSRHRPFPARSTAAPGEMIVC